MLGVLTVLALCYRCAADGRRGHDANVTRKRQWLVLSARFAKNAHASKTLTRILYQTTFASWHT